MTQKDVTIYTFLVSYWTRRRILVPENSEQNRLDLNPLSSEFWDQNSNESINFPNLKKDKL